MTARILAMALALALVVYAIAPHTVTKAAISVNDGPKQRAWVVANRWIIPRQRIEVGDAFLLTVSQDRDGALTMIGINLTAGRRVRVLRVKGLGRVHEGAYL